MINLSSWFQSKTFKGILYGIGVMIVLLITFQAGVMMGYKRANFSFRWAENYPGNFFPPPHGDFMKGMNNQDAIKGHGALGEIITINNSLLTVKGKDEVEKAILIGPDTQIEHGFDVLKATDLKVGDHVLAIGSPNDAGQIQAKIVRVLPHFSTFIPRHKIY